MLEEITDYADEPLKLSQAELADPTHRPIHVCEKCLPRCEYRVTRSNPEACPQCGHVIKPHEVNMGIRLRPRKPIGWDDDTPGLRGKPWNYSTGNA